MRYWLDLDIIAGITQDEGTSFVASLTPQIFSKNVTKDDFVAFVKLVNDDFHNMNLDQVTAFYLNNTNLNNSDAIKSKIFDFYGDVVVKCPAYRFAKRYAELSNPGTNVFFYELTYGSDLTYVFGLPLLQGNSASDIDINFSKEVTKLWTDFAKYGYELRA